MRGGVGWGVGVRWDLTGEECEMGCGVGGGALGVVWSAVKGQRVTQLVTFTNRD